MVTGKGMIHTVYNVENIGKQQCHILVGEGLKNSVNKHLGDVVNKNKLPLFKTPHEKPKVK